MNVNSKLCRRGGGALVVILLGVILAWYVPMWPFRPVYLVRSITGEKKLMQTSALLTQSEAESICKTLENYNEVFARIGNVVFIAGGLFFDDELRWNYTTKSELKLSNIRFFFLDNGNGAPPLWSEKVDEKNASICEQ